MSFARFGPIGFLSHLRSLRRYDEQEILHFSLTPFWLVNADAGQYFVSHSTVSQRARVARAFRVPC
jgi:hypothetical protein